jgi:hypothetical protein
MAVKAKSLMYEVPENYDLKTSDSILAWVGTEAERQAVVDAFNEYKSAIDVAKLKRNDRWAIAFFIGYDSDSGWSFGLNVGFTF